MNIYELESSLTRLLSIFKKNRENVPLETLKTYYKEPYEALVSQINQTASAYVRELILSHLPVNPDADLDEQISVVQQVIDSTDLLKQMGRSLPRTYSVQILQQLALQLRRHIEDALYPYTMLKTYMVYNPQEPNNTPIIYNLLTKRVWENNAWIDRELDLTGKYLISPIPQNNAITILADKENIYENSEIQSVEAGEGIYINTDTTGRFFPEKYTISFPEESFVTPSGIPIGEKLECGELFFSDDTLLKRLGYLGYAADSIEALENILEDDDIYIHKFENPYDTERKEGKDYV